MDEKAEQKQEALRLKTLAEQKYNDSNLKSALKYAKRARRLCPKLDGVAEMVTAFKILRVAAKANATTFAAAASAADDDNGEVGVSRAPDWYKIIQVEPFSHINTIKKQYKKLALTLHPDKNHFVASEEAFKLVGEAFRVLSDKIRRKEYDMKLRIAMQSAATEAGGSAWGAVETFWTACSTCRLLHQFERRYLGHNLMCPSCKKSFKAVEVSANVSDAEKDRIKTRSSVRVRNRERWRSMVAKQKTSSVGEVLERSKSKSKMVERVRNEAANKESNSDGGVLERLRSTKVERLRIVDKIDKRSSGGEIMEKSKSKRVKTGEETMTLAEMQLLAKRKVHEGKLKLKTKEKEREKEKEKEKVEEKRERRGASKGEYLETEKRRSSESGDLEVERQRVSKNGDLEIMPVEDSDFYDFDKDRVERSFKKGQVWAIYDDDDGMPRHYGLVDEVVSVYPFEVKISWLDLQNNGDEGLICWEKMGFHISCGRFKVARKTSINSVNIFSHIVDCDRAAREVYRIYPKKGSVWALYNENALDSEGRNLLIKDKRYYDIVVFLTSYSEIHGLSMAHLEKVDGFKTVFKRREIGCHAIRWLEKDDVRLFSHHIPARKLSGEEASDLAKDCWELDPASLPPELLCIGWER
ncbi:hypothetical protein F0562_007685 [Nyssa sinensis]|uniref:J domain-containing protein n=1 Tax=Nyssa sinensis TaxID=561372 RepID=A0A5J5A5S2_9ASTE|nr:hypothetical protein F0562_007685 [Nyssa sinensis]